MEQERVAVELTKLVVVKKQPAADADFIQIATDYLAIYRSILNDLRMKR